MITAPVCPPHLLLRHSSLLRHESSIGNFHRKKNPRFRTVSCSSLLPQPSVRPDKASELKTLWKKFYKVASPYWFSEDKDQARLRLAAVFALTLATTGISVGFNFLGRDFYNSLASTNSSTLSLISHFSKTTCSVDPLFSVFNRQRPRAIHQAVVLLPLCFRRRHSGEFSSRSSLCIQSQ